jgi:hypothetical protein
MSESDAVTLVHAASLEVHPSVTETCQHAGARDDRLGADIVTSTARMAVAAWAMAVEGDDTALTAIAQPHAAYRLLHPVREHWQVAPGPRVNNIKVSRLDASAEPPRLRVCFQFAGRRRFEDPCQTEGGDRETLFLGLLNFTLQDPGRWPWQLSSGHVETLDQFLGYVFTSRRESPEEYCQRARSAAKPASAGPQRVFRLIAGFAEHDERLGSSVSIEVKRETAPTRDEAKELVWPAIWAETRRALGDGDWRPSLNWLDVVELLDHNPQVDITPESAAARASATLEDQAHLENGS